MIAGICWLELFLFSNDYQRLFLRQLERDQPNNVEQYLQQWLKRVNQEYKESDLHKLTQWAEVPQQGFIPYVNFPESLKTIADPPILLFYQGNPDLIYESMIAVVGSRKPSPAGLENAKIFSHQLAISGLVIISGLACGIDAAAHQMALSSDQPTVAVMGCGLNHCYPARHKNLRKKIHDSGLLLSEFHPELPVSRWHFPRRNRLISGLSEGVLVVEAAIKSGSLVTARHAGDQGRQVFAIPGDIQNPMVAGCHHLIREGAQLVTHAEEVLEAIFWTQQDLLKDKQESSVNCHFSKEEKALLDCLDRTPRNLDIIIARSGYELTLVLDVLFSLELKGMIIRSSDGYYKPNQGDTC